MIHPLSDGLRAFLAVGVASLAFLLAVGWACTRLPLLLVWLGRPRRARAMMRLLARKRWPLPVTAWLRAESLALLWDGRFDAARERARAMRTDTARPSAVVTALEIELLAAFLQKCTDESRAILDGHRDDLRRRAAHRHWLTFGEAGLAALVHLHDGEYEQCRAALRTVLERTRRSPAAELALFLLAAAAHREGRDDEARGLLDTCLARPSGLFVTRWAADARAEVASGAGPVPMGLPRGDRVSALVRPSRWEIDLLRDLREGLGALFFLRGRPARGATFERLGALVLVSVLATALAIGAGYSQKAFFLWPEALALFCPIGLLLAAAWVAPWILGIRARTADVALALFRSLPFVLVCDVLARTRWHRGDAGLSEAEWALAIWWAAFVLSQMKRAARRRGAIRRVAAGAVVAAAWLVPLGLTPHATPWIIPMVGAEEYEKQEAARTHRIHDQGAAVAIAEAKLLAERPGVSDLYFVGVAGTVAQDVFAREVRSAQALFDERFHTRGRSIILSNGGGDGGVPLATELNLEHVLAAVGTRMNRDEDILFLFVTSHGSKIGIALDWDVTDNLEEGATLEPGALRADLDRAGIQWRILVLSACHSGAFVEPLRDQKTIVFTAAASDRQSFGCKNGADYTEFGRALLAQRLPEGQPFVDTFELVRSDIRDRERAAKLEPSLPQLFVGDAIAAKLRDWRPAPSP